MNICHRKSFGKMLDKCKNLSYNIKVLYAGVMELADVADSKSAGETRTGSSPVTGTICPQAALLSGGFFLPLSL